MRAGDTHGPSTLILGLVVLLYEVNLDVTAELGAGDLLGNLVCSVADLFAGGPSGQVS